MAFSRKLHKTRHLTFTRNLTNSHLSTCLTCFSLHSIQSPNTKKVFETVSARCRVDGTIQLNIRNTLPQNCGICLCFQKRVDGTIDKSVPSTFTPALKKLNLETFILRVIIWFSGEYVWKLRGWNGRGIIIHDMC